MERCTTLSIILVNTAFYMGGEGKNKILFTFAAILAFFFSFSFMILIRKATVFGILKYFIAFVEKLLNLDYIINLELSDNTTGFPRSLK